MTTKQNQQLIASFASLVLALAAACGKATSSPPREDLDRRLTRAECEAGVAHAATLLEADPPSAAAGAELRRNAATAIDQCLATARVRDHRCLMAAKDARELGLCPMPGSNGEE